MSMGFLTSMIADMDAERAREDAAECARRGLTADELQAERDAEQAERVRIFAEEDARMAAEQQRQLADEAARRAAFGASVGLGVSAHVGHIIKLGGLSARSNGDGMTRGTVWHVVLGGVFRRGRLVRSKGDLLCRPASSFGRRGTMAVSGSGDWGDRITTTGKGAVVSCVACNETLARLRAAPSQTPGLAR